MNFESGEKLIAQADECLADASRALERGSWNTVIRRSQEAVELSLKGVLRMMGVEYPKIHDPYGFFSLF